MSKLRTLGQLFWTFFQIGLFTFGGGYAMIPLIESEIVDKHRWLSSREMIDLFVIAESTPGPVSVNAATYVGYRVAGLLGAFIATLGLALPSFVIILLVAFFYQDFMVIRLVQTAFMGIQAGVAILIIAAALRLGKKLPRTRYNIIVTIFVIALQIGLAIHDFHLSSIYFILLGLVLGLTLFTLDKQSSKGGQ